jgi:hypothetical protein
MANTQELINQMTDERIAGLEARVGELETQNGELAAALYEVACEALNRDTTNMLLITALKKAVGGPEDLAPYFEEVCQEHRRAVQMSMGLPPCMMEMGGLDEYADPFGPEG